MNDPRWISEPTSPKPEMLEDRFCPECGSSDLWLNVLAAAVENAEGNVRLMDRAEQWTIRDDDTVSCGSCRCFWRMTPEGEFVRIEDEEEGPNGTQSGRQGGLGDEG